MRKEPARRPGLDSPPARVEILGVPVDAVTEEEALARVESFLCPPREGETRLVFTPNPELVCCAQRDPEMREALRSGDLNLPDGAGLVLAAKLLRLPVKERVTGVDIMPRLLELASRKGYSVFFLGTRPEVVPRAAGRARELFPGLQVAGVHHGYFPPEEEEEVVAGVRESRSDLLFAGLGFPREQKFLWRHRRDLGVRVAVSVGGSLDVLAGVKPRAPGWMRRAHLEWLYRLLREPWRARRMTALPWFAGQVLWLWMRGGRSR